MHTLPLLCVAPSLSLLWVPSFVGDVYVDTSNPNCAAADGTLAAPFCTVGAAIAAAASGDTIHIAPGVYVENLILGFPLTLVGTAGAAFTILDGNGTGCVLEVQGASTAVLDGLTIRNGRGVARGGGIDNRGDLSILNSIVTDNVVVPGAGLLTGGAGIFNDGDLSVEGTTVANNTVQALPVPGSYNLVGAGILSWQFTPGSTTVLVNSTIRGNQIDGSAVVPGGYAYAWGAGLGVLSSPNGAATFEMTDCSVRDNSTTPDVLSSTGAGLYLQETNAVLTSSTIADNVSMTINGPIAGGVVSFHGDNVPTTAQLRNCTVSGNTGIGVFAFGDGPGPLTLEHCTITGNTWRGLWVSSVYSPVIVELGSSIVAANTDPDPLVDQDLIGDFVSLGYNLVGEAGAGATGFVDGVLGDQVGTHGAPLDAGLLSLADNGGPTWTHALAPTSPAIDAADPLSMLLLDQRGFPRPSGAADIGAYELAATQGLGLHVCDGVANSAGAGATVTMQGSATLASNDLRLDVAALPQLSLGYFLTSRNALTIANPGGSQGNLCIASLQMGRYAGQVLSSGTTGTVSMAVDLTALPLAGAWVAALVNETWYWQYWYRDMNPTSTSNFSAARGLTLQ